MSTTEIILGSILIVIIILAIYYKLKLIESYEMNNDLDKENDSLYKKYTDLKNEFNEYKNKTL